MLTASFFGLNNVTYSALPEKKDLIVTQFLSIFSEEQLKPFIEKLANSRSPALLYLPLAISEELLESYCQDGTFCKKVFSRTPIGTHQEIDYIKNNLQILPFKLELLFERLRVEYEGTEPLSLVDVRVSINQAFTNQLHDGVLLDYYQNILKDIPPFFEWKTF